MNLVLAGIRQALDDVRRQVAAVAAEQRRQAGRLERLLDQAERVAGLEQRLAQLEARPPRDEADRRLLVALAMSTAGAWFTSSELWRHAVEVPDLRAALLGADVTDRQTLGLWLRSRKGVHSGIAIDRRGRLWRATHATHNVSGVDRR